MTFPRWKNFKRTEKKNTTNVDPKTPLKLERYPSINYD